MYVTEILNLIQKVSLNKYVNNNSFFKLKIIFYNHEWIFYLLSKTISFSHTIKIYDGYFII